MQNQMVPTANQNKNIFFYFLLLTGFFLLFEISFFIQCNKAYFADFSVVSDKIHIPVTILPGILYFILAQLVIHAAFCIVTWLVTILIADLFHITQGKSTLGIAIWLFSVLTVLVANQCFFPNSKFAELTQIIFFNEKFVVILFYFLSFISLLLIFATFVAIVRILPIAHIIACLALVGIVFILPPSLVKSLPTKEKPNIIIVGIDALRPDFLSFFGNNQQTPFLDGLLAQSTVFSESLTPLARTFPSWTSILTGEYPRQSGARFDLADQATLNLNESLPAILKNHGYFTAFATDETRFSNIDTNFGFDQIIAPRMGLNDFLLGTFNDFPLSNFFVNTWIGKKLFPFSYANRPVFFTYDPNSFLHLVQSSLYGQSHKPLFLAIHFCLPHSPYVWASLASNRGTAVTHYQASVLRVDRQLQDFFSYLKQSGVLKHAIVILLSDHGEGLELPGDRITEKNLFISKKTTMVPQFYPPSLDKEEINQSAGHGTDVLGLSQYHTLLAVKLYDVKTQVPKVVQGIVSLLSVKPTILHLINVMSNPSRSLVRYIIGPGRFVNSKQDLFLESDFSPASIRTVYPETRKVLLEGAAIFQVNPKTTRLTVKNDMARMIINSKQYANIHGEWMLALYPQAQQSRMPILINLRNGEWTNDLTSTFARKSPAASMLVALKAFYRDELGKK